MDIETQQRILLDVRQSQRFLMGFYQRLMPALATLASQLYTDFYVWKPEQFWRPGQLTTNPFARWTCDMLPMFGVSFLFLSAKDPNSQSPDEWLLEWRWVSDSASQTADFTAQGEPDPLKWPEAETTDSYLELYAWHPAAAQQANWYQTWMNYAYPELHIAKQRVGDGVWYAMGRRIELHELSSQPALDKLSDDLRTWLLAHDFPLTNGHGSSC